MLRFLLILASLGLSGPLYAHSFTEMIQGSRFADEIRYGRLWCVSQGSQNYYDSLYRGAVHKYYPPRFNDAAEWCWMKCKGIVESGQNPNAVSPVGAMGVMQIMPGTFSDFATRYGWNPDDRTERTNILMSAAISSAYFKFWVTERSKAEHRRWQQGSYYCGPGCLLRGQVRAGGSTVFDDIKEFIPTETARYVPKIKMCHARLAK